MKKLLKKPVFLAVSIAIASLLIGYISNQLPALKELLQAKNWQDMEKIFAENRIAIAAFFAIGLLIIWFTYQQVKQQPEDAPENIDPTIRPRLLEAEATKVKQRLRDSLHNLLMLDLLREEQPQEVGRKPLQTLYTVSVNNAMSQPQVLDEMVDVLRRSDISGRLLILGQPGGGKTTTLLDLAEELLDKAKQDDKEPMPMIFELSAWRDDSVSILDWLILQLKQEYNLAPGISRVWLEQGEILPLLDGLDELGLEKQRKCIQTINQYLAEDKKRDLVVCCREEEYHEGEELLSELHGAVCLQELSDGQIRDYLHQLNRGDLWQSIQSNSEFLELARIPLLLSMMLVAYQGRAIQTKEELFDAYIERRFELLPVGKGEFSRQKIMRFLAFLAQRLRGTQTEFLIENMQPSWLQNQKQIRLYELTLYLFLSQTTFLFGFLYSWRTIVWKNIFELFIQIIIIPIIAYLGFLLLKLFPNIYSKMLNPIEPVVIIFKPTVTLKLRDIQEFIQLFITELFLCLFLGFFMD
ncbi:MAG: NACHT domain-containing protein [Calothrix sp. CSU_2_0]|nr:NACHT domain-containing protein [Calothrix sp. CSU_2_0]